MISQEDYIVKIPKLGPCVGLAKISILGPCAHFKRT